MIKIKGKRDKKEVKQNQNNQSPVMVERYFRVKHKNTNRLISMEKFQKRNDAIAFCEKKARSFIPPRVNPSTFKDTSVVFIIELVEKTTPIPMNTPTSIDIDIDADDRIDTTTGNTDISSSKVKVKVLSKEIYTCIVVLKK